MPATSLLLGSLLSLNDQQLWLFLAGRGVGKTRAGAEWIRAEVERGRRGRLALIGPTAADVRDVMVEGESGIRAISPPETRPQYQPTRRRLYWPHNGATAMLYSAEEPDRLRGPQHDGGWGDELAAWAYPETWDQFLFGLRLGSDPRAVVTTTPRPTAIIRDLMQAPTTVLTRGTTYENAVNLAPAFLDQIVAKYAGTRLGRQELMAEILADVPGALWKRDLLDALRVTEHPELARVVVAVDPEASSAEGAAETGIVVAGLGSDGHGYVLQDCSIRGTPDQWGRAAVTAYHTWGADRLCGEVNNGGEMVGHVIRTIDPTVAYKALHASRGKAARAEPVAALYEQQRAHHVGFFTEMEDQQCSWVSGAKSPDRLDALVWALTELMLNETATPRIRSIPVD